MKSNQIYIVLDQNWDDTTYSSIIWFFTFNVLWIIFQASKYSSATTFCHASKSDDHIDMLKFILSL